jgi:hypothetical protein
MDGLEDGWTMLNYLSNAPLERVTAPQLTIEFLQNGGQQVPVVVRPVSNTNFVHVMMPLVETGPTA